MGELTDQLRSFLGGRRYAVLATDDPDGGIHSADRGLAGAVVPSG